MAAQSPARTRDGGRQTAIRQSVHPLHPVWQGHKSPPRLKIIWRSWARTRLTAPFDPQHPLQMLKTPEDAGELRRIVNNDRHGRKAGVVGFGSEPTAENVTALR